MPLYFFYTMVQKSQKSPKTQIKGGPALVHDNMYSATCQERRRRKDGREDVLLARAWSAIRIIEKWYIMSENLRYSKPYLLSFLSPPYWKFMLLLFLTLSVLLFDLRPGPAGGSELPSLLLGMCREISFGLVYLSSRGFVHRVSWSEAHARFLIQILSRMGYV